VSLLSAVASHFSISSTLTTSSILLITLPSFSVCFRMLRCGLMRGAWPLTLVLERQRPCV
jgi:hypothetical protein